MSGPHVSTSAQLADLIGKAIDDDGLTQAEFCRRVGVSEKHLSMVLNGHAIATVQMFDYWAFALGRHFTVRLVRGVLP